MTGRSILLIVFTTAILATGCRDPVGSAGAVISLDSRSPLVVELTLDGEAAVPSGAELTVSAEVTGGSPPYTYAWYLNGDALTAHDGPSAAVGPGLPEGGYRLSVVVSDGAALGSADIVFEVLP